MITPLKSEALLWGAWLAAWVLAAWSTAKTVARQTWTARLLHSAPIWVGAALLFFQSGRRGFLDRPLFTPSSWTQWTGVALTALGLAYAGWARLHLGRLWSATVTLKADHALIRSGPYGVTRHPIYTGLLCALLGTMVTRDTLGALIGLGFFTMGFVLKIRQEEQLLTKHFGEAYAAYRAEVPALIPFL